MFVHCCHCLDCQRQTGSAFVLNALIETDRLVALPPGVPAFEAYYDSSKSWPAASLVRRRALFG